MKRWSRSGFTVIVFAVILSVAFGLADNESKKKAPLKKAKKYNANEGDVRLVGSKNIFEGKLRQF